MKKLMMLVAALATACAVQGASFTWKSDANGTVGATGSVLTSATDAAKFVLCYLGTSDNYSFDNAVVVQEGTWTVGTSKGKATAKVGASYNGSNAANGGSFADGQVYAVMVQADNGDLLQLKLTGAPIYTVSGYIDASWPGPNYIFAFGNYIADKKSYGVPEPTSALLLVLGGAMLALRRRV